MERLSLAGLEDDQASPGVSDVGTVPPSQLVLLVLHLQPQCSPGYPVLSCTYQISAQDILSSLANIRYFPIFIKPAHVCTESNNSLESSENILNINF